MIINSTLNQKLFKNEKLKPEIREQILKICKSFIDDLSVKPDVLDIQIVGSNASYNYTENSDLDVHIITNFELLGCDVSIVKALFDAEKSLFNKNHNITIKGINVELYVEDVNSNSISNGIYSVINNSWVKYPEKIEDIPVYDISRQL